MIRELWAAVAIAALTRFVGYGLIRVELGVYIGAPRAYKYVARLQMYAMYQTYVTTSVTDSLSRESGCFLSLILGGGCSGNG